MKFNVKMPLEIMPFFKNEIDLSNLALASGELQKSWTHLERAHIIGQNYAVSHTYTHWKMMRFGVINRSFKEVLGQVPRLLIGGVKSFVGVVPVGNTGGSNVPPLKAMPIPPDLKAILNLTNNS